MSVVDLVGCPKCEQMAGRKCRTLTTGRVTDTHQDRYDAYYNDREARMHAKGLYTVEQAVAMLRHDTP